ncbi:MAG TPA: redox-sensing transcriptional repressor Rex [Chloroflexi bacterium]|nr:redox-sensing transcriptional repressor Rex [Chloroflexota bacterium]
MPKDNVPEVVIQRLPLYLRSLTYLAEQGRQVVSSGELGRWVGVSPAQIRKDLSFFGEFGKQGMGYEVDFLCDQLRRILQVDQDWHVALVGAGTLGHALINYRPFEHWNYHIVAVFDNDRSKIGQPIGSLTVQPMSELRHTIIERHIEIGVLAIPAASAQEVAEELMDGGVRGILNYAPINLNLPPEIRVAYIDPVVSLQSMTHYL